MSEKLDPEEVIDLINSCFKKLTEIIYRYEGTVDKYMGDCIIALFGAPVAHEDDPERAVKAAMENNGDLG
jgi:adenylate cyclase